MRSTYKIFKPNDFKELIADLLRWSEKSLENNLVIALRGDLGAGKTTFVQTLAGVLGVTEVVNSPTFSIIKSYSVQHSQFNALVHMDAYRLESEIEAAPLRLGELLTRARSVVCIEWPQIVGSNIPKTAIWIDIDISDSDVRVVTVKLPSENGV